MGSFRGPVGAINRPYQFMPWDPTFMFWSRFVVILVEVEGQDLDLVAVKESLQLSDLFSRDFLCQIQNMLRFNSPNIVMIR